MKAEGDRVDKALQNVDEKAIEKEVVKSIDMSTLFIKKVQNELVPSADKKSKEIQNAEE